MLIQDYEWEWFAIDNCLFMFFLIPGISLVPPLVILNIFWFEVLIMTVIPSWFVSIHFSHS